MRASVLGGVLVLLVALGLGVIGAGGVAHAQDRDAPPGRAEAEAPRTGGSEADADADDEDVGAQSEVVEEKGGKVKVVRFSGIDIAGELKSPQLLYFLNRLRAEFDRPKLPHRSFVPELIESTQEGEF